jgi:hypothetical protein
MSAFRRWTQRRQWEKSYDGMLSQVANIPEKKVEFHIKHLDEYLLRWLGFCRLETKAPQSLIDNQLFLVVEAATIVAGKDMATMGLAEQQAWQKYQESILALPKCRVELIKESAEQAYLHFKEFVSVT